MRLPPTPEAIGPDDCPMMYRWTIFQRFGVKLLVHHFLRDDPDDAHDHPASFITLVLAGRYADVVPCSCQDELEGGMGSLAEAYWQRGESCPDCDGSDFVVAEWLRPGSIRFRRAEHAHRVEVGDDGEAWTVVLMFRKRRPWGFWRQGAWWPWRKYRDHIGFSAKCTDEEKVLA